MRLASLSRRAVWLAIAGLAIGWVVSATLAVPALIRAVHASRLPFAARLLPGRASVPVAAYLTDWAELARAVTFGFATVVVILAGVQLVFRRGPPVSSPGPGEPSLGDMVLTGLWFGLAAGLGEAWYVAGKVLFLRQAVPRFPPAGPNVLWMAPLGNALLFASLALILGLLYRRLGRRRPGTADRWLTGTLAALTILAWIMITGRLYLWAAGLLAIGLAISVSRSPGMRLAVRRTVLPRRILGLALVPVVLWIAVRAGDYARERRALPDAPAIAGAPNVVLLVLDTQRAQSMSLYGYGRPTTPRLDQLAGDGVVFERAIAAAPWTLPSHATMLTGRYLWELGMRLNEALPHRFRTITEALHDRGYRTAGFVANTFFCNDLYGLDQGFGRYRDEAITPGAILRSGWLARTVNARLTHRLRPRWDLGRRRAETVNREFLGWLNGSSADRPFFVMLNYFDSHDPYVAPAPFGLRFAAAGSRFWMQGNRVDTYSADEIQELKDNYEGGTAYVDAQVGALMDALRDRALLDRTVVIVVGDHGEEFGEKGAMGHRNNLYLPEIWVPLLIRYPARVPAGRRVPTPVSLRNISATILDLAGTPLDSTFPGVSLARHWRGDAGVATPDTALSEFRADKSLVAGDYHFVRHGDGRVELYDLRTDAGETTDLSRRLPDLARSFGRALGRILPGPGPAAAGRAPAGPVGARPIPP